MESTEKGSGCNRSNCGVTELVSDKARLPRVVKASAKSGQTSTVLQKKTEEERAFQAGRTVGVMTC